MNDLEEIGLDDDDGDGDAGSSERGRPHAGAPQRGSLPSTLRDLTTHVQLKRPSYPPAAAIGLSSHQPPSVDHLAAPAAASGRSKKLHAAPALPRGPAPPPRSRHASPVRRPIVPLGHSHPNGLSNGYRPKVSPGAPKRTPLQRKTSEQLEDEYDSDDEVPPDAIFYNVPLSPRFSPEHSPPHLHQNAKLMVAQVMTRQDRQQLRQQALPRTAPDHCPQLVPPPGPAPQPPPPPPPPPPTPPPPPPPQFLQHQQQQRQKNQRTDWV